MKQDTNQLIIIIFVLIIIILIIKNKNTKNKEEGFRLCYESSPSTRNMSYDLRGDPCIIPKQNCGIMDSSIEPHYRKDNVRYCF